MDNNLLREAAFWIIRILLEMWRKGRPGTRADAQQTRHAAGERRETPTLILRPPLSQRRFSKSTFAGPE